MRDPPVAAANWRDSYFGYSTVNLGGRARICDAPFAMTTKKPWSGRFAEPVSELVKRYTASVGFDRRLAPQDIRASLAHARMLRASAILSRADLPPIDRGLAAISMENRSGKCRWSLDAKGFFHNIDNSMFVLD